jgi:KDO2-lipid IV(A) lauroyltransferase
MSVRNPSKAKYLQWRIECIGHTLIECIAGLLPGPWVFRVGECLGALAWPFMGKRRRIVIRNLRIAFAGEMDIAEIQRMAKASFCRTAANMISVAYTARLSPKQLKDVLRVENLELLERALAKGRGVVLLLAHMGNWELLSRMVHFFPEGSKAGAMYRHLNNIPLDRRTRKRREADGTRMFSKNDGFHQVTGFLRDGGIVGILADQRTGRHGDLVPFFGRLTRSSPLPSLLARRSKSELLALSLVTESPGKWRAEFLPVKAATTADCMQTLEQTIRRSPIDVFWLQERWKFQCNPKNPINTLLEDENQQGEKAFRALAWLSQNDPSWQVPKPWTHSNVHYEFALPKSMPRPSWISPDAHIHEVPASAGPASLRITIEKIDDRASLPIDFVLTKDASPTLAEAASAATIPLIRLP